MICFGAVLVADEKHLAADTSVFWYNQKLGTLFLQIRGFSSSCARVTGSGRVRPVVYIHFVSATAWGESRVCYIYDRYSHRKTTEWNPQPTTYHVPRTSERPWPLLHHSTLRHPPVFAAWFWATSTSRRLSLTLCVYEITSGTLGPVEKTLLTLKQSNSAELCRNLVHSFWPILRLKYEDRAMNNGE